MGMDRKIKKKKWPPKRIATYAAVGIFVIVVLYIFLFKMSKSTLNVIAERLTISTVSRGPFQEYIPIQGTVEPIYTHYLDPLEGGIVEAIYVEAGEMIKKGDKLEEKRTLIKEGKKKRNVEDAELKIEGIKTKFLAYGPVGFLSWYWQYYFQYEIAGKDKINGKKAIVIEAAPTEEREDNYYSGKIWVDENDYSILKIEWVPKYIKGYEEDVTGGVKRNVRWAASYEVEKNGIRFPSKQLIEEVFITEAGKEYPSNLITIIYDNYKFFMVEVDVVWD